MMGKGPYSEVVQYRDNPWPGRSELQNPMAVQANYGYRHASIRTPKTDDTVGLSQVGMQPGQYRRNTLLKLFYNKNKTVYDNICYDLLHIRIFTIRK